MAAPVRVLIVDDQEPFRVAAACVVEATAPFVVAGTATSGEECLAVVPALRPDLVLMDVGLPGIDGVEAARRLAALPRPPAVVLVSSYDEDALANGADGTDGTAASGAVAYVSKSSFGPERLAALWALVAAG